MVKRRGGGHGVMRALIVVFALLAGCASPSGAELESDEPASPPLSQPTDENASTTEQTPPPASVNGTAAPDGSQANESASEQDGAPTEGSDGEDGADGNDGADCSNNSTVVDPLGGTCS